MEDNGHLINTLFRKHGTLNVLSLLTSTVGPLVCSMLTGVWYGSEGLAVVALCAPLFFLAGFLGFTISGGASVLAAKAIARDEMEEVNRIYSAAAVLSWLAALVIFGGLWLFRQQTTAFLAGNAGLMITDYYVCSLLYAFTTVWIYLPLYFSRIAGQNKVGLLLTVVMTVVTLTTLPILKPLFGLSAIVLSQAVGSAAAALLCMILLRKQLRLVLPRTLYIKQIAAAGSPMGLPRLYNFIGAFVLNSLFLRAGGANALAVYGVTATLNRLVAALTMGASQTVVPLAGVFHEECDITSTKQLMKTALHYGNLILLISCVLLLLLNGWIEGLFGLTPGMLLVPLVINSAYLMLNINASLFTVYYNASGHLLLANSITFLQDFALMLPLAWLLSGTVFGVWMALPLASLGTLVILLTVLWRKTKDGVLSFPLLLDESRLKQGTYISFSVESVLEKASEAASKIADFCEEQALPPKQTMLLSMALEEMLTLTIRQIGEGFPISVRLSLLEEVIIMRIRNGGVSFDPIAYYKENISDDLEKSVDIIGIKYVVEAAEVVYYRQIFGVNNLVVIL